MPYSFTVTYIRGRTNVVSDCLSRLPDETSDNLTDFNVNIVAIQGAELPCLIRSELASATASDTILQDVIRYTSTTWPKDINRRVNLFIDFAMSSVLLTGCFYAETE